MDGSRTVERLRPFYLSAGADRTRETTHTIRFMRREAKIRGGRGGDAPAYCAGDTPGPIHSSRRTGNLHVRRAGRFKVDFFFSTRPTRYFRAATFGPGRPTFSLFCGWSQSKLKKLERTILDEALLRNFLPYDPPVRTWPKPAGDRPALDDGRLIVGAPDIIRRSEWNLVEALQKPVPVGVVRRAAERVFRAAQRPGRVSGYRRSPAPPPPPPGPRCGFFGGAPAPRPSTVDNSGVPHHHKAGGTAHTSDTLYFSSVLDRKSPTELAGPAPAHAVGKPRPRPYNPLFIYGTVSANGTSAKRI